MISVQKKTLGVIAATTILLHALEIVCVYISLFLFAVLRSVNFSLWVKKIPLAVFAARLGPLGHGLGFGGFSAAE